MELDNYMTATEFAEKIDRPYNTVLRWLKKGWVPRSEPKALGNETRWFIHVDSVKDFKQWDPTERWGKRGKAKTNGAAKKARKSSSKKGGAK
jgi:hypothetical protein